MQRNFCRTLPQSLNAVVTCGVILTGALCTQAQAQESLAGVSAGTAAAAGLGAMGATVAVTEAGRRARDAGQQPPGMMGGPDFGAQEMQGGPPAGAGGGPNFPQAGMQAPVVMRQPDRWSTRSGQQNINELLRGGGSSAPRVSIRTRRARARAEAANARRLARLTPAQRRQVMAQRYRKPPVGWLGYYLPQDRYKLTSGIWKYVSIEDDPGYYPVRYYYRPSASTMLRLLSRTPRGIRRYNRVIGFHTWQDAMLAGYRPDPVTRPEPGTQLANLARMTRGPQLARYVEFIYSGQVAPESFNASYNYILRVQRTVNSRSYTRPLLNRTVARVLGAILGEGPLPRTVGGSAPVLAASPGAFGPGGATGGMGGPPPGFGGPPQGFGGPPPGMGGPPPGFGGPPGGFRR
ncbi:MAG TPA: hypothetical protein VF600_06765 [Abditibacteriaceae bacterium]|jgi:hypothetical protein